jgi:hypothetical protein
MPGPAENTQEKKSIPQSTPSEDAAVKSALLQLGRIEPDAAEPAEVAEGEAEAAEVEAEEAEAEGDAADGEEAEADEEGEEGEAEAPAPAAAAAEAKAEDEDPRIERTMAALSRRESQLVQRERAIAAKEREAAAAISQNGNFRQMALEDPGAFYKALGVSDADLSALALQLYVHNMGDSAPPDLKQKAYQISLDRKIKVMESREREREQQARTNQQMQAAYQHFAKSIPSFGGMAYLAAEASENPHAVAVQLTNLWAHLRDTEGFSPSQTDADIAEYVAGRLNESLASNVERIKKVHLKPAAPAAPKTPTPAAGENKPAKPTKSIGKKATALTRPSREARSHEDDVQEAIRALRSGRYEA